MSNSFFPIVWCKLQTKRKKRFCLVFPVSLFVFRELLDCLLDLMELICFFAPKNKNSVARFSVHAAKELAGMLLNCLGSIHGDGPYELIDVFANDVKVSIKVG
jgi:hypothetical protein